MGLPVAVVLAAALAAANQGPSAPLVVRLGVDLVQIDVVVTDRQGRVVPDLTAADFEIRQDGRSQSVSQAVFVRTASPTAPAAGAVHSSLGASADALPPSRGADDALVFVVDDLALSLRSVDATRRALLRFADAMEAESRVFLLRTSRNLAEIRPVDGPASLRAAARAIGARPNPDRDLLEGTGLGAPTLDPMAQSTSQYLAALIAHQSLLYLQDIMDALRSWKGRKTVVLFSEGYPLWNRRGLEGVGPLDQVYGRGDDIVDAIDRLTDIANRASVVVHTIDPRGLVTTGFSASDSIPNPSQDQMLSILQQRRSAVDASQGGLSYLAERTGGLSVFNSNDVLDGVGRVLAGSRSYYLVGYEPERLTFVGDRPRFHKLEVRVKRRGLKVRTRKGFFGVSDETLAVLAPPQTF